METDVNVLNRESLNYDYFPENWVLLKFDSEEHGVYYKVLGGWSGGYTTGDSWRMNSGIEKIEQDEDYYYFIGFSGSIYKCDKNSEIVRMNIGHVLNQLLERDGVSQIDAKDIEL